MTTEDAKAYLSTREIPQLFESLMTGLMYYRPEDHITYLQECLKKIRDGNEEVRWNLFIQQRAKTPLPPIPTDRDNQREPSFITESRVPQSLEEKRGSPLPPIGQTLSTPASSADRIKLPNCPIVLVMGGPGSGKATQCKGLIDRYTGWIHLSMGDLLRQEIFKKGSADEKWGMVSSLVQEGEMAPEEMAFGLIKENIEKQENASGIIIEGYPRTLEQIQEYEKYIGRVDLVFMLDCEEHYLQQRLLSRGHETGRVDDNINAVAARIAFFKEHTLPAIKHFDDQGKLVVIDGDRDGDVIFFELAQLFDNTFYHSGQGAAAVPRPPSTQKPSSPRPGSTRYNRTASRQSRPNSGFENVPTHLELKNQDSGRVADMPQCPLVLLIGGPGSGCSDLAQRLQGSYNGSVHLSGQGVTSDALIGKLQSNQNATAIFVDSFPSNKEQLEEFNLFIGGANLVVVLDTEEDSMRQSSDTQVIREYKHTTLPVISFFDDQGKVTVVSSTGDQAFQDVTASLSGIITADSSEKPPTSSSEKPSAPSSTEQPPPSAAEPADEQACDEKLKITVLDAGRVEGMPTCSIISIAGAPGSGFDVQCKKLVEKVPGAACIKSTGSESISTLVSQKSTASVIFLEGFPSTAAQVEEFNKTVGGMDAVLVVDCEEGYARSHADGKDDDISKYKEETLETLAFYDDLHKLEYIKGERSDDEIFEDVSKIVEKVILADVKLSYSESATERFSLKIADTGRKEGVSQALIVSIVGAPSSKTGDVCKKVAEKFENTVHICAEDQTADQILDSIKQNASAKVIILENFPASTPQADMFNDRVGGMNNIIVLDTSEQFEKSAGTDSLTIAAYKATALPILGHYEESQKLDVINGEDTEETVMSTVCKIIDAALSCSQG